MLTLIAARARNGAIGKDNAIPWHLPADMAFFKRETLGGAIVMGRLTWESLPFKPLKNRINYVVSSDVSLAEHVHHTPQDAVDHARKAGCSRIYGIGGEGVYRALLPLADRLLITEVETEVEAADAFFPEFEPSDWQTLDRIPLEGCEPAATVHEFLRRR